MTTLAQSHRAMCVTLQAITPPTIVGQPDAVDLASLRSYLEAIARTVDRHIEKGIGPLVPHERGMFRNVLLNRVEEYEMWAIREAARA